MGGFPCVVIEILIRVQVCDCAAYDEPFRKHYFKCSEDTLMMTPKERLNRSQEILCIRFVYIPVHVRFVSYVHFDTMHGTRNINL